MQFNKVSHPILKFRIPMILLLTTLLLVSAFMPAQARTKVEYIPGITLVPEVLQPDGTTARTYNTPKGLSLWTNGLPVLQGDVFKLNVFVATGGANLKEIIVRLDNNKIADVTMAPWSTLIHTDTLTVGYHMIEVWAQSTGDPPQSSTQTQTFYVAKEMPVQYKVQGIEQQLQGGTVTTLTPENNTPAVDVNMPPPPPAFLQGQTTDAAATVALRFKMADAPASTSSTPVGSDVMTINEQSGTDFYVERPRGSAAVKFAYALVRNGRTINETAQPLTLTSQTSYYGIRIRKRTDTLSGLRSGPVTLWVWGIDKNGQPGNPVKALLNIP